MTLIRTKGKLIALGACIALACLGACFAATATFDASAAFAAEDSAAAATSTSATASDGATAVDSATAGDAVGASGAREVKILFTHDIHSNLDSTTGYVNEEVREYGGAARLKTLLTQNTDENTVYLDAGDFSMGTLYQAGFNSDAYELRTLGNLGCAVTTFGNHEWDQAGTGLAKMLRAALASGDELPQIVMSNLDFSGELTDEQLDVQAAFAEYGVRNYTIVEVNGVRLGIFGVSGENSIEDSPTAGMNWTAAAEAAQATIDEIGDQADIIVCLSHSGTDSDGENGEDFELIEAVPDIDIVISGHSHSYYPEAIVENGTILASAGEYLKFLGSLTVSVASDGTVTLQDYELIPIDDTVSEDTETQATLDGYKASIAESYLETYAPGASFDEVIAYSPFDFMSLDEMYATHQEYPLGDLIADAYLYEAQKNGIDDIDVALVGLGTIRGSFFEGEITTSDAFDICSLGVGADGSAGHPLVSAYVTGKELKLLTELDASLGTMVNSIKMSYAGLCYEFNTARALLDRVTDVKLVRADGTTEEIKDDKYYRVCCNMYAANMLGMLNSLTKGVLSITPKQENGLPVEDFYKCSLLDSNGNEIKEWVAFRDYLMSFDEQDGVSTIPTQYASDQGRKVKVTQHGLAAVEHPGAVTLVLCAIGWVIILSFIFIVRHVHCRRPGDRPVDQAA